MKKLLTVPDKYTLIFFFLMLLQSIFLFNRLENPVSILFQNIGIIVAIFGVAYLDKKFNKIKILHYLRNFYHIGLLLISYNTVQIFIEILHPQLYDELVASIDMMIFGFHACQVFGNIAHPFLTEFLQICYFSFYFGAIALAIELLTKDDGKHFDQFLRYIVFSFILLFLLYYAMPVIGPRFYLYDFTMMSEELPGLYFTEPIRQIINTGCNVPDPTNFTFAQVNPDCVPSGHTWIELIVIAMAFKTRSRFKYIYLVIGSGLIFSTLYLRYHYLFDLILGVGFFFLTYYFEPKIARALGRM
jgi:membrane-associated phospholipid phosphatase